jgi:ribosomal-protein-alanine N-acetyltransferase
MGSNLKKVKSMIHLSEGNAMEIKIETATIELLDKLCEIEKQSFQKEAFTKQQIVYLITSYNSITLVARGNDEIVGFAIGSIELNRGTTNGHVLTIEALPSYRRRGIAKRLLKELETFFKEKGAVESRLEVREDNVPAVNLYLKLGYIPVVKLERYYKDAHGLYLKKKL